MAVEAEVRLYWPLSAEDDDKTVSQLVTAADRSVAGFCLRQDVTPSGMARDWRVVEGADLKGWGHHDGLVLTCVVPVIRHPTKWEATAARVRELNLAGLTDAQIGVELGFSYSTARRHRRALGLVGRGVTGRKKSDWDPVKQEALVRFWHGQGLADRQIGLRIGLAQSSVSRVRGRLGLVPNGAGGRRKAGGGRTG